MSGPLSLCAVTATSLGTVTVKPTLHGEFSQSGAASVSRPWDTDWVTAGGPFTEANVIISVTWTCRTGPPVTTMGAP